MFSGDEVYGDEITSGPAPDQDTRTRAQVDREWWYRQGAADRRNHNNRLDFYTCPESWTRQQQIDAEAAYTAGWNSAAPTTPVPIPS